MSDAFMYDNAVAMFTRGELDWPRDSIRLMLVTGDYQPSQASDVSLKDVRRFEVDASGTYQRGGAALADRDVARSEAGNDIRLLGGTVRFGGFTGQFRYAIVYQANGSPELDRLVTCSDLGRQEASNARVTVEYGDTPVAEFTAA
jgi:hypothetical protein